MTMVYRILIAAAALALVILFFSDGHRTLLPPGPTPPSWSVRADAPFVVGGYGDNFAYSGKTVRLRVKAPQAMGGVIRSLGGETSSQPPAAGPQEAP